MEMKSERKMYMKIVNSYKKVLFKELKQGDVFHTSINTNPFMKTESCSGNNTVSLLNGALNYCGPDAIVYVVDCELVMK